MILCVFMMKGMEGYQMLFTGSKNIVPSLAWVIAISNMDFTYDYIAVARFKRDYLKIANFELKNLSSPTFFEQSTWNFPVILKTSFPTDLFF